MTFLFSKLNINIKICLNNEIQENSFIAKLWLGENKGEMFNDILMLRS